MTFDEWHKIPGNNRAKLHRATGVSYATLRKVDAREAVSWDTAMKLADYLQCEPRLFVQPKPKRKPRS